MDELYEQLKTIKNLTEIAHILIQAKHSELLPTVLEYLHEISQDIVDNHCVKE